MREKQSRSEKDQGQEEPGGKERRGRSGRCFRGRGLSPSGRLCGGSGRLPERELQLSQHPHFAQQHRKGKNEDGPARKIVQKAFGHRRAPAFVQDPREGDPGAVDEEGEREGGKYEKRPLPEGSAEEVGEDEPQDEEGKDISEPAAGFHHLELGEAEVDDVPLPVR